MKRRILVPCLSVILITNASLVTAQSLFHFSKTANAKPSADVELTVGESDGCGSDTPNHETNYGDLDCAEEICDSPCDTCCGEAACGLGANGSFIFDVDLMFMKYHQAGGVQSVNGGNIVGNSDGAEFAFNVTPRFILGYERYNGFGYRASHWSHDESASTDNGGTVDIDTYTFDLEIYRRVQIGVNSNVEISGGYRGFDFNQTDETGLDWGFTNWGGTVNMELSHHIHCAQRVYVGSRWAIVMGNVELLDAGDLDQEGGVGLDHQTMMTELVLGWEARRCASKGTALVYGFSGHWWQWSDTAITGDGSGDADLVDAGFGGFTFRVGVEY